MRNLKLVVNNVTKSVDKEIFFVKKELQTILNLYGKMVSNGSWKDYGVSIGPKEISFDIYQRASEKPIYRILKNLKPTNYNEKFYIKDKHGNITDPLHKTLPFITKYEKARILGERAKQIASGAIPLINVDETIIDSYIIATKEFEEKAIPFIIKRPLPSGGCEYWKLADLEILV